MLLHRKPHNLAAREQTCAADAPEPPAEPMANGLLARSLLDTSVAITGDLTGRGDLQLDGHVCGSVSCARLTVGRDAAIAGAIRAEQVVVCGRVTGTIRANLVILHRTARVEAEITYSLLAMDEGAAFEGLARCRPNPLQEDTPPCALDDLQRTLAGPRPDTTPCAVEAKGRGSGPRQPPRSQPPAR